MKETTFHQRKNFRKLKKAKEEAYQYRLSGERYQRDFFINASDNLEDVEELVTVNRIIFGSPSNWRVFDTTILPLAYYMDKYGERLDPEMLHKLIEKYPR